MQHTTNYDLNQWDADDRVTREDFNADNAKIDAALAVVAAAAAGKLHIETWTYTGDGAYGESHFMHYRFTKRPALIVVIGDDSFHIGDDRYLYAAVRDANTAAFIRRMDLYWSGTTASFASVSAAVNQANSQGTVYRVMGVGV